jgi:hypothetical protein
VFLISPRHALHGIKIRLIIRIEIIKQAINQVIPDFSVPVGSAIVNLTSGGGAGQPDDVGVATWTDYPSVTGEDGERGTMKRRGGTTVLHLLNREVGSVGKIDGWRSEFRRVSWRGLRHGECCWRCRL